MKKIIAAAALATMGWHAQATSGALLVGAASSLTNVFTEIATAFQQQYPDTKVLMSFASSDAVAAQVIPGTPMDIFASADNQVSAGRGVGRESVSAWRSRWAPEHETKKKHRDTRK